MGDGKSLLRDCIVMLLTLVHLDIAVLLQGAGLYLSIYISVK